MRVASPITVEPISCYIALSPPGTAEVLLAAVATSAPSRPGAGRQGQPRVLGEGMTGMSFHFGEPSSSFKVSLDASFKRKYILTLFLALLSGRRCPSRRFREGAAAPAFPQAAAIPRVRAPAAAQPSTGLGFESS